MTLREEGKERWRGERIDTEVAVVQSEDRSCLDSKIASIAFHSNIPIISLFNKYIPNQILASDSWCLDSRTDQGASSQPDTPGGTDDTQT
jgi:hypothetical protein